MYPWSGVGVFEFPFASFLFFLDRYTHTVLPEVFLVQRRVNADEGERRFLQVLDCAKPMEPSLRGLRFHSNFPLTDIILLEMK